MSQHFHTETRTARKAHVCDLCARRIDPGEKYRHGAGMDGATAWTWKECAHCDVLRDLVYAQSWEDSYDNDLIAEWDPETVNQLRLKAMWKRKWTRTDGTLMPVPVRVMAKHPKYEYQRVIDVRPAAANVPVAGLARGGVA